MLRPTALARRITLRQLQVLETVAHHAGINRAAQALHLTQPTVSAQMKQLAGAVGAPLFEKVGRKLFLTESGNAVLQGAQEILDALRRLEDSLAELKGLRRGRLRVAVVTTAKYFVPRLLGPFVRRYPGIDVSLDVGNRAEIIGRLARNEDDLYIMGMPPAGMDIVRTAFVENPIVAVAPAGHPLTRRRRIPLAALAKEPFLLREAGSGTRMAADRFLREKHARCNVRMELGSNEAIKQAIAGGLGLSLLSLHALGAELARRELALLDVEGLPIRRSWYIVHRSGKQLSLVARTFFAYLKDVGPQLQLELDKLGRVRARSA